MGKTTLFGATMVAVSMTVTVSAQAGPPAPFVDCEYYDSGPIVDEEFKAACVANLTVKDNGHYIGSCAEDGGRCYESVAQKLGSALDKYRKQKTNDALIATCTIYRDADTWANSKKPKLSEAGFALLTAAVDALANHIEEGAKCSP